MIARTREIRIRKRNPTVRLIPQDIPRRRLAVHAKEKTRLRIYVRVSPAIEDDSRDVPARIESAGRKHVGQLLAERSLILRERSAEQLRSPLRMVARSDERDRGDLDGSCGFYRQEYCDST